MSNSQFSILETVSKAWLFAARNRAYLLRISGLPLALHLATAAGLQGYRADASMLELFLWALPANIAFAWLMFAEARFLLLGERVDRLPQDPRELSDRRHSMRLCVLILLLCNMAFTAAAAWMDWSLNARTIGANGPVTFSVLFLLGFMFWGLRFFVVHILAAVGYPIRPFLARVHGIGFSVRLLGMAALCAAPVYFLLAMVLGAAFESVDSLTPAQMMVITLATAPVAFLVPVVLNAAAAFALKEILGRTEARA